MPTTLTKNFLKVVVLAELQILSLVLIFYLVCKSYLRKAITSLFYPPQFRLKLRQIVTQVHIFIEQSAGLKFHKNIDLKV